MKCVDCEYCVKPENIDEDTKQLLSKNYSNFEVIIKEYRRLYPNLIICKKHGLIRVDSNLICIEELESSPTQEQTQEQS